MSRIQQKVLFVFWSATCLVVISCQADVRGPKRSPVAHAGLDRIVKVGDQVYLDGERSYDPDGGALEFAWSFVSLPQDSLGHIVGKLAKVRFLADIRGRYIIGLVVTDEEQNTSRMDIVQVRAEYPASECTQDIDCDDNETCTTDTCVNGICSNQALGDGTDCDDGKFCTVEEYCQEGRCGNSIVRDCSAQPVGCWSGVCDEKRDRCLKEPLPLGTVCDDELFCTVDDTCDGEGVCTGKQRICEQPDSTCLLGICDEGAQRCAFEPANETGGCDDGDICTETDSCQQGVCVGTNLDKDNDGICDPLDECLGENETGDTDQDGYCNNWDENDDNDGWEDSIETICGSDPLDSGSVPDDSDGDGTPDCLNLVAFFPFDGAFDDVGPNSIEIFPSLLPPVLDVDRHGNADSSYSFNRFHCSHFETDNEDSNLVFEDEITVSAWINPIDSMQKQKLLGRATKGIVLLGWSLGIINQKLHPQVWDTHGELFASTGGNIDSGFWTHVAFSWKTGGTMKGYVNGKIVLEREASGNPISNAVTTPFKIGVSTWADVGFCFDGNIDNIRIYSRELTPLLIRNIFHVDRQSENRLDTGSQ